MIRVNKLKEVGSMKTRAIVLLASLCLPFLACGPEVEKKPVAAPAAGAGIHPTAAWIMACRTSNGGFGCFPGDSAYVSRTGMAVEALYGLGALRSLPEREATVKWLQGMQQPDGGFIERGDF